MSDHLQPQHLDYFASRAYPLALALERGCRSVSHNEAYLLGFRIPLRLNRPGHSLAGVLLPVHRPNGATSAQLRLDTPIPDPEKAGKSHRYLNLPGQPAKGLDIEPSMRAHLADPTVPRFVTEGIAKVGAMAGAGFLGLGMTGVWMGVEKLEGGGYRLHADWELVALPGCIIFMTFDSDQMQNREVHRALKVLSDLLRARGCLVLFLHIPPTLDGDKQGIDDFLATGAVMAELIANASTLLPIFEPGDDGETCAAANCPERRRANHNAGTLGLIHAVLSDEDKPLGARAAFLSAFLEARWNPDRDWDYQQALAKKVGMKSVNTFRNHIAPFIRDRDNPDAPIIRRSHRDEIPDESAPQGVRYVERIRYDLRSADDMDVLAGYLKVVVAQPDRKPRQKVDPATCAHPSVVTEEAEVDRCAACDTVRDIRPLREHKNCAVGEVTPPEDSSSTAPPIDDANFEVSGDEAENDAPDEPTWYAAGQKPSDFGWSPPPRPSAGPTRRACPRCHALPPNRWAVFCSDCHTPFTNGPVPEKATA